MKKFLCAVVAIVCFSGITAIAEANCCKTKVKTRCKVAKVKCCKTNVKCCAVTCKCK